MSKLAQKTEVLVSGAGPVGMLTALLLKQNGIDTQIIDQESRTAGHSYSCVLHPSSLQLLYDAGVIAEVFELGRCINSVGFYQALERQAEAKFSELTVKYPFALVLPQNILEYLLEQKLRQVGVTINWNHRLADIESSETGATAFIEKLGMTGKGFIVPDFEPGVEKSLETKADYIVGTDGSNSLVRARLGVTVQRAGSPQRFAVFEVESDGRCGHEGKIILDDKLTSVLWPITNSRYRWSFQIDSDDQETEFPDKDRHQVMVVDPPNEKDDLHQLRRFLKERAPWFQSWIREVVWSAEVQFQPRLARHFGRGVSWLAGDAAHQTGPAGMQSMNIGFREAADLADILTRILHKGGSKDLLHDYDRGHWSEWEQLLGGKLEPAALKNASDWVRQKADRIIGSVPASGAELSTLLKQMGINFQSVSAVPQHIHPNEIAL